MNIYRLYHNNNDKLFLLLLIPFILIKKLLVKENLIHRRSISKIKRLWIYFLQFRLKDKKIFHRDLSLLKFIPSVLLNKTAYFKKEQMGIIFIDYGYNS